jgi:spore maturation protein CgeB
MTDYWEGIELFLEPDQEVIVARDGEEVASRLSALTPSRAREMGDAGQRRILAEHTYDHRVAKVERLLGAARGAPQGVAG